MTSMSSAVANSVASVAAHTVHVAVVVMADGSLREVARSLLAALVPKWTGTVAVRRLEELVDDRPDAVVLVADASTLDGMAALRRIRKDLPAAHLVVVARDDSSSIVARQAINAGAEAFVPADRVDRALRPALDAVIAGFVCAPRTARRLVAKPTFSHREKEVLEQLVAGLTNGQIAARLHLAESTVKTHLVSAFSKLGVRSRKDAVALLLDPAEGLATAALPPDATSRGAA
jgi:DNA-binding NarL/FixJ family response regulator